MLLDRLTERLPKPGRSDWLERSRERWLAALRLQEAPTLEMLAPAMAHPAFSALQEAIFGNSPYLSRFYFSDAARLGPLLLAEPEESLNRLMAELRPPEAAANLTSALHMSEMRRVKRAAAFLIAACDLGGVWSLDQVTRALSDLADAALDRALWLALRQAAAQGRVALGDDPDAHRKTGFVIMAMGKHGARELNYSSDIDVMALYDSDKAMALGRGDPDFNPQRLFVQVVRTMVALLQERTEDGYVFRVDLRLRPDPAAMPVAISVNAAELYYESFGQNWERAAMIKARAAAGDLTVGEDFLRHIQPFIWRKHLDFAAIEDIHSVKRQIHASKGHGVIGIPGHNLKVGRGGIREIEFFAQTQQLISGGRDKSLRSPRTCDAIRALTQAGRVTPAVAARMTAAYEELRRIEHRLQMIEDEQTHSLPRGEEDLAQVAVFCGDENLDAFAARLTALMEGVQADYAGLFEKSAPLSAAGGNLVFTGVEDDPDTLETLARMGFSEPAGVAAAIRGWHHGRYRAMRSERAREKLTKVTPRLLEALAKSGDPQGAFERFDALLAGLPSGVQLFSLFYSEPQMMDDLAEMLGGSAMLGDILRRHPYMLDAMMDAGFYAPLPAVADLRAALDQRLNDAEDFETALDVARRAVQDRKLQVGLQMLRGAVKPDEAGAALARLAEAALASLWPLVEAEFARAHGRVPGGRFAVIAMGRLGSGALTFGSDLDLIFIYDHAADAAPSDGAKPLAPSQYYARLSQRFISALTSMTQAGRLYDVDMRLRPSGNKGPVAVGLAGFEKYHREEAWTWEHMALCRARAIAGDERLCAQVTDVIGAIITRARDPRALHEDVWAMRARIAEQFPPQGPWDLKYADGGLIDLEFLAAEAMLRHGADHRVILDTAPFAVLARAVEAGLLPLDAGNAALAAGRALQDAFGYLRLGDQGRSLDEARMSPALLKRLGECLALQAQPTPEALRVAVEEHLHRSRKALLTLKEALS